MEFVHSPEHGNGVVPNCIDNGNGHLIAHSQPLTHTSTAGQVSKWITTHLTEQEIHIICGLYVDRTSKFLIFSLSSLDYLTNCNIKGFSNQLIYLSWWPLPSTWEGSGLNVQYWSSGCESWFISRVNAIKAGTAKPMGSSQWKKELRKKKSKLTTILNILDQDFIPVD